MSAISSSVPENTLLTDVTIEGLRGVGRVELGFTPGQRVYCLFGRNGVGKTKCLEALWQFLLFSNKDFGRECRFSRRELVMDHMQAKGAVLKMPHRHGDRNCPLPRMFFRSDDLDSCYWPVHRQPVVLLGAGLRAGLNAQGKKVSVPLLGSFDDRRTLYLAGIVDAIEQGELRNLGMSGDIREWIITRLQSGNPNIAPEDNRAVETDTLLVVLHAIDAQIDPEQTFQYDGDGNVFLKVNGEKRELGELSSGFAALLKMVQAIIAGYAAFTNEKQLQNVRGIVLIDEIDAHLHVEWQGRIIPCLKKLFPNTTFYVATHSPLVLMGLADGEAYLLERGDNGVVTTRMIEGANRRLLADILEVGFGVNPNQIKRGVTENDDQSRLQQEFLALLPGGE